MRILLIEDQIHIASFILKGLEQEGFAVDHEANGEDGLHRALTEPYDASIIDIMLPKLDGLSLIAEVRRQGIQMPILILSAKRSVSDRVKGLQGGSDDYLTKPFAFSELSARVHALIRRAQGVSEATTLSFEDLILDLSAHTVTRQGKPISLQPLEFSLLEYLLRNQGKIVTKTMIMEHVWNYNFNPQTNVVEVRICKLREKIDRDFNLHLIHTIHGVGYVIKKDN
jgi:two-component system, OmpR family, response regulator